MLQDEQNTYLYIKNLHKGPSTVYFFFNRMLKNLSCITTSGQHIWVCCVIFLLSAVKVARKCTETIDFNEIKCKVSLSLTCSKSQQESSTRIYMEQFLLI